ncbi:hypothetical protein BBJ28_00025595 [Nothophytophthora sp. Chile5]|nr:hypothetical protein BBJ28_00025595 [Nothophytophthora sp. Chile5]
MFMVNLGMTLDLESSPEPIDQLRHASAARKRPASSSPLKETDASRRTRHVPAKHGERFYQSEDSHDESCKGGPSEEGEIAQPHQAEEVSNLLDEQQEDYLSARQSQFTEMRTPTPGQFEILEAAQQRDRRHLQEAQSNLAYQRDRIRSLEVELGIGRSADPNAYGIPQSSLAFLRQEVERHDRLIYEIHDRIDRRVTYDEFSQMRNDIDRLTQSLSGASLGHRGPEQRQYALQS